MTSSLDALLQWYETLTPDSLRRIDQFYAADARFKDPFNDVQGLPAIEQVFAHMFVTTERPRFVIQERLLQGQTAFATWRFEFGLKGRSYVVVGGSLLHFNEQGKVIAHRDYWDPAEELWQKLPLLGPVIAWLRRQFAARSAQH